MRVHRVTILTPGAAPDIDVDVQDGSVRETGSHVHVSLPASVVGTDDVEGCPITVSGERTDGGGLGSLEREFTYSGEIVDVAKTARHADVDRLQFACRPGSLDRTTPRTVPGSGGPP
jgi:hypothetical protein